MYICKTKDMNTITYIENPPFEVAFTALHNLNILRFCIAFVDMDVDFKKKIFRFAVGIPYILAVAFKRQWR